MKFTDITSVPVLCSSESGIVQYGYALEQEHKYKYETYIYIYALALGHIPVQYNAAMP